MNIMLVEDHAETREEICALIESEPGLTVVAAAESGEVALELARKAAPDVVVMDILLPGMNGIEATRRILSEQPGVRLLALSNHLEETWVKAMLAAGGLGYVQKSRVFEDLIPALQAVHAGMPYVKAAAAYQKP